MMSLQEVQQVKEREAKRYLEYLGQEPSLKNEKDTIGGKKQAKRPIHGIIRMLWSSLILS